MKKTEPEFATLEYGKPSSLPTNGEYVLRMSFLMQAAKLVQDQPVLSRHMIGEAKNIAKRNVLRIDPGLKKEICKVCNSMLPLRNKDW